MNYIKKKAKKFTDRYIAGRVSDHEEVVTAARSEVYSIDSPMDKATFLRVVLEENERGYQDHLIDCTDRDNCQANYDYESISYFLTQELNRLGIRTSIDQFTVEEKVEAESRLEQILSDLQTLKDGQQITYEDLRSEIESLKELFILGKKTWKQLLLGKTAEMVAGGIISETISKQIISAIGDGLARLG